LAASFFLLNTITCNLKPPLKKNEFIKTIKVGTTYIWSIATGKIVVELFFIYELQTCNFLFTIYTSGFKSVRPDW
jgi:hypothetical protein